MKDEVQIPKGRAVLVCDIEGNLIQKFDRLKDAAKFCGTYINTISACCRGKKKSARGYTFKYLN